MKIKLVLLGCSLLLGACASTPPAKPNDPNFAPVQPGALMPPPPADGSIYQQGYGISLWEDQRARRVGDVLTINLQEQTVSTKKNTSTIKKDNKTDMAAPTVMGVSPTLKTPGILTGLTDQASLTLANTGDAKREFAGSGNADQSNKLVGSITVTVAEVLPNGVLVVRGEKWMTLTNGEEFIRIQGLVRTSDIRPDNSVLSTRLADARITYSGTGELADAGHQGWLAKFFNSGLWPF